MSWLGPAVSRASKGISMSRLFLQMGENIKYKSSFDLHAIIVSINSYRALLSVERAH